MPRHVVILPGPPQGAVRRAAAEPYLPPLPLPPGPPRPVPASRAPLGRRRRRRVPWPIPLLAASSMGVVLVLHITRPVPLPRVALDAPAGVTVPGIPPTLAWPAVGQAAVAVPDAGLLVQSGPEGPVPIASVTKIMTAYVVLRDHPLGPRSPGPRIVMSAVDEADSAANARANATSIPIVAGQAFSERQLLDGLIVHSANDFADALARWDAGSVDAFVAKMNLQASELQMRSTHYVDPSGIDQAGTSTAADQLHLADAAMAVPAFAAVADQPSITVPGVGLLSNYVPAVGTEGVIGVKSGFTQAAKGCVVLAAERLVAGRPVLVLAALTGQQGGADPLRAADTTGISLIDAAAGALAPRQLVSAGLRVGTVRAPWTAGVVALTTGRGVTALVWPGDTVSFDLKLTRLGTTLRAGQPVGVLEVRDGSQRSEVPVVATSSLDPPGLRWRFARP